MSDYTIKQEGKLETLPSGAKRGSKKGKPRFDLIPTRALLRVASHYGAGGVIHGDRNWEQGIPLSELFGSLLRHAYQFSVGETDEDHLAAVVFNALAIMHFQEEGREDLVDFPPSAKAKAERKNPEPKKREPAWVGAKCPHCGQIVVTLGGLTRDICINCSFAFNPKENLEKPLTSEPPPAKVKATRKPTDGHWIGCPCPACEERRSQKSHPQEKVGGSTRWECPHCGTEWVYAIPGSVCISCGPKCPKCLAHLTTIGGSFRGGTSQLHPTH